MIPGRVSNIQSLFEGSKIQESLLQSYRKIQFTSQSLFLLIGVFTTREIIVAEDDHQMRWLVFVHFLISGFALISLFKIRSVIKARSRDVDHWHRNLLIAEQQLKYKARVFTHFKLKQKLGQVPTKKAFKEAYTSEDALLSLIEKYKGHTRKVLDDQLMWGYVAIWISFLVAILKNII